MSRLRRSLITERSVAKEQAQQWLYRDAATDSPFDDLAVWRAACLADAVQEHRLDVGAAHLIHAWEKEFDSVINESVDPADRSVTRAVIAEDMWCTVDLESPAFLLVKRGDIVTVLPSPFPEYPLSITPRAGCAFCAKCTSLREITKVLLSSQSARIGGAA